MMRFSKRTWQMSIKRFLANFDRAVAEVVRGRVVGFIARRGQRLTRAPVLLVPIHKRERHHPRYRMRQRVRMCRQQQRKW